MSLDLLWRVNITVSWLLYLYLHFGSDPISLWNSGSSELGTEHISSFVPYDLQGTANFCHQGSQNKAKGLALSRLSSLQAAQLQTLLNFTTSTWDSPSTQSQDHKQDHTLKHQNITPCCCLRRVPLCSTLSEQKLSGYEVIFMLLQIQTLWKKRILHSWKWQCETQQKWSFWSMLVGKPTNTQHSDHQKTSWKLYQ